MTKRGSLVYYLSAWILGCFFVSLAVWLRDAWRFNRFAPAGLSVSTLLTDYFFALLLGALPSLIFGFVLRRVASRLKCKTAWHWAMFGAALVPLLVMALGTLARVFPGPALPAAWLMNWFGSGPSIVLVEGLWLGIPAGAATGYFLGRIQRAFAPPAQAPSKA